jgi:hypothetical protein
LSILVLATFELEGVVDHRVANISDGSVHRNSVISV